METGLVSVSSRIGSLPVALGLVTPFQVFGADFVLSLPGCSRIDIPPPDSGDGRKAEDSGRPRRRMVAAFPVLDDYDAHGLVAEFSDTLKADRRKSNQVFG